MKRRKCQDGPETYMQQIWYLISVTSGIVYGYTEKLNGGYSQDQLAEDEGLRLAEAA
jgi:hypothetical protein